MTLRNDASKNTKILLRIILAMLTLLAMFIIGLILTPFSTYDTFVMIACSCLLIALNITSIEYLYRLINVKYYFESETFTGKVFSPITIKKEDTLEGLKLTLHKGDKFYYHWRTESGLEKDKLNKEVVKILTIITANNIAVTIKPNAKVLEDLKLNKTLTNYLKYHRI